MKKDELKMRVTAYAEELVDNLMPADGIAGRLKNATAKLWIHRNAWRMDSILSAFEDRDGCIDPEEIVVSYEDALFEDGEFKMDPREIVPDSMSYVKALMPNKIVVFHKDDLHRLVGWKPANSVVPAAKGEEV